jgi:pimeloyl-ACP methyl ester carboxylesterase
LILQLCTHFASSISNAPTLIFHLVYQRSTNTMVNKPVFVFVPGAWHAAEVWSKVSSLLKEQGYNSVSISLPTTSGDNTLSLVDDVKATQEAIQAETSQGRNVVVVVHSYGGVVGESAIKSFTAKDGTASSNAGHVIGLFVIASGFAQPGMVFLDGSGGKPPPMWRLDPSGFSELQVPAREAFYHDLPEAEGDEWVAKLTKQSSRAFTEGRDVTYAGWQDVPVWMLITTEDKSLPAEMQRMFAGMVKDTADLTVREIDSSHSPMLSKPKEVVELLLEATQSFTK